MRGWHPELKRRAFDTFSILKEGQIDADPYAIRFVYLEVGR